MTLNLDLKPIWLPVLTTQPWMLHVVSQLGDLLTSCAELVGVDIGYVDTPGLVASVACVGFVARGSRIEATYMQYRDYEAEKFDRSQQGLSQRFRLAEELSSLDAIMLRGPRTA